MNPLVSIIMPAYNTDKTIEYAIKSILDQTYSNFELIICDDGSKDKTLEKIKSINDERIIVLTNDENIGNLLTTNKLLAACRGEFIAIQDADDFSYPDRIKKQINALNAQDLDLVGTQAGIWFNDEIINRTNHPSKNKDIKQIMFKSPRVPIIWGSVLFKRKMYEVLGGFDVLFDRIGAADYNWLQRASFYYKFYNLKETLYLYRQHSESFTKKSGNFSINKIYSEDIAFDIFTSSRKIGRYDSEEAVKNFERYSLYYQKEFSEDTSRVFGKIYNDFIFGRISFSEYVETVSSMKTNKYKKTNFILHGFSAYILGVKRLERIKEFLR